jgi:hypothetical protein
LIPSEGDNVHREGIEKLEGVEAKGMGPIFLGLERKREIGNDKN